MIQKTILMKAAAAVVGAAVITGAAIAVTHLSKKEESYRSILIYELKGKAEIEREGAGTISGAENLYLESGDLFTVAAESFTRLRLDDDKFVLVEEDSVLSIEAAGTKEDSRTRIHLTQGAIVNELRNPLSSASVYEVTTPNSVMAVRGTVFRVEVFLDEKGEVYTRLSVFGGQVASRLIYPDGTRDEEVLTEGGREVIIHSNEDLTEYLGEAREISYQDLPPQVLYSLLDMAEGGAGPEGISPEELRELIRAMEHMEEQENRKETDPKETSETVRTAESTEESRREEETKEADGQKEPDRDQKPGHRPDRESAAEQETVPETAGTSEEPSSAGTEETGTLPEETPEAGRENCSHRYSYDDDDDDDDGGGSGGGRPWESSTETRPENPGETSSEHPPESSTEQSSESQEETSEEPTGPSGETPEESSGESEPAFCTVTFLYEGAVFGTQQVERGQCAAMPWLNPETGGGWEFDFDSPVTEDTVISWKQNDMP